MKTEKRLVVNNEKYSFELLMAGIPSNVFTWQQVLSPSRKKKLNYLVMKRHYGLEIKDFVLSKCSLILTRKASTFNGFVKTASAPTFKNESISC